MTWLDEVTMSAATALVVTICGLLYVVDTLTRRGNAAARLWSAAFIGGILTTTSYLLWTLVDDGWIAAAIGNAALVGTTGALWLGCRLFNRPLGLVATAVVPIGVVVTLVATLLAGPDGGPWAGAWAMFAFLAVFSGLGCAEARRGRIAQFAPALWLTIVLGVVSAFYVARTAIFLSLGPGSAVFEQWFGTPSASVLTIVMTITAVVAMVVLRVQDQADRDLGTSNELRLSDDGYLDVRSFHLVLSSVVERARAVRQPVAVVVVRVEGLDEIAAAFGSRHAAALTERWRALTLEAVPLHSFLADDRNRAVYVAAPGLSDAEAFTLAGRLSQHVHGELAETESEIVPVVGIGLATGVTDRDAAALVAAAAAAAGRSAQNLDAAVVLDAESVSGQ